MYEYVIVMVQNTNKKKDVKSNTSDVCRMDMILNFKLSRIKFALYVCKIQVVMFVSGTFFFEKTKNFQLKVTMCRRRMVGVLQVILECLLHKKYCDDYT